MTNETHPAPQTWLTIAEAAKHSKMSGATVRRWVREGLPIYREGGGNGGKILITVAALDAFLLAKTAAHTAAEKKRQAGT